MYDDGGSTAEEFEVFLCLPNQRQCWFYTVVIIIWLISATRVSSYAWHAWRTLR